MRAPARFVVVVPVLAMLGWLGYRAMEAGYSGVIVQESLREMSAWATLRRDPSPETWLSVHDDLMRAEGIAPGEPNVRELVGVLDIRRTGQEFADESAAEIAKAIELRPTSPYSWANFASSRYRLGDSAKQLEPALVRSTELGPYEPEVQRIVAYLGLALWDEVGPQTKAAVGRAVAAGAKRNPLEMLQIGERRGRLDLVCGHVADSPRRIGLKWAEICQSLEATS